MTSRVISTLTLVAALASAAPVIAQDNSGAASGGQTQSGDQAPAGSGDQTQSGAGAGDQTQTNGSDQTQVQTQEGGANAAAGAQVNNNVNVDITQEQQTQIQQSIQSLNVQPVTNIDFNVSIGVTVPTTVTLQPLPATIVSVVPQFQGFLFFVLADGRIVIVNPTTLVIVLII